MVYDQTLWRNLIHVDDHILWGKTWLLLYFVASQICSFLLYINITIYDNIILFIILFVYLSFFVVVSNPNF